MASTANDGTSIYPQIMSERDTTAHGPFYEQIAPKQREPLDSVQPSYASSHNMAQPSNPQYTSALRFYDYEEPIKTLGQTLREVTAIDRSPAVENAHQAVIETYNDAMRSEREPSKKRSKISRACDECRRKKTKCDSAVKAPCTACEKSRTSCEFSREPQKRGPSKGYIKELSDRLNALEHQQNHQSFPYGFTQHSHTKPHRDPQHSTSSSANAVDDGSQRKRTFSDTEVRAEPGAQSVSGSDMHLRQLPLPIASQSSQLLPSASDLFRCSQKSPTDFMDKYIQRARDNQNQTRLSGTSQELLGTTDGESRIDLRENMLDECLKEYYRLMHPTFPVLSDTPYEMKERLSNVTGPSREAFKTALEVTIRTNPATSLPHLVEFKSKTKRVAELLTVSQFEGESTEISMNQSLIYIQTLILMALQADNYGPATLKGILGPPRSEWLGRAIAAAGSLKLNSVHPERPNDKGSLGSDESLGRRIWWTLFVLDRWHSSSTSTLLQVPENSTTLEGDDRVILGEGMYHLARLSAILGHLTHILQQPALMAVGSQTAPILTLTIMGELDRFKESANDGMLEGPSPGLIDLAYWHVRLMALRLTSWTSPHELLIPALKIANILNSSATIITPLNHHFAALCGLTLAELCAFEELQEQARRGIDDIAGALEGKRGLMMGREDSAGWDGAIRELVMRKKKEMNDDGKNKTRTADERSPATSNKKAYDPTRLTGIGYLAALVQGQRSSNG